MYELNLIKDILLRAEANRRIYSLFKVFCFFSILMLLAFVARFVSYASQISHCRDELVTLQKDIDKYRKAHNVEQLETEWVQYQNRIRTIDGILQARTKIMPSINEFVHLLPEGLSIQSLKTGRIEGDIMAVTVISSSPDHRGLGLVNILMGNMMKSTRLSKNVKLGSQQREGEVESFSISSMVQ